MMLPSEVIFLAESRREAIEHELRVQRMLAELPASPARWRRMTGRSMMWAGTRLVNWGNSVAAQEYRLRESIGRG